MGTLTVPSSGLVYFDTNPVIYSVERHPAYGPLVRPLWQAAKAKAIEIVSSELVLMESLVGPLKSGDAALAYELLFRQSQTRLLPALRLNSIPEATNNDLRRFGKDLRQTTRV